MFTLVDTENTGVLKPDQIEIVMRALGYCPSRTELSRMSTLRRMPWAHPATGLRGEPTQTEGRRHNAAGLAPMDVRALMAFMPRRRNAPTKEAVRDALEMIERGTNARLSKNLLRHALTAAGDKMSVADVDEVFRDPDVGAGNDSQINKAGTDRTEAGLGLERSRSRNEAIGMNAAGAGI